MLWSRVISLKLNTPVALLCCITNITPAARFARPNKQCTHHHRSLFCIGYFFRTSTITMARFFVCCCECCGCCCAAVLCASRRWLAVCACTGPCAVQLPTPLQFGLAKDGGGATQMETIHSRSSPHPTQTLSIPSQFGKLALSLSLSLSLSFSRLHSALAWCLCVGV